MNYELQVMSIAIFKPYNYRHTADSFWHFDTYFYGEKCFSQRSER